MKLEEFSLKQPHWVIVGAILVIIIGIVCITRLPKDILPIFKIPAVQVITFYPGMPAEVVEKDMTTRLERWTGQSNGIAMQESKSMIGVSILKDFFRPDIDPNTAMSQVTSFAMSDLYYLPPGTIPPMVMPFDPTASIPLALLTVENPEMNETKLYDVAYFNLRNMLQGIPGVIAPAVYGGKLRRILAYIDPYKMAQLNVSGLDVVNSLLESNVMIPTGNAKFGDKDYQIITNAMPQKVNDMNQFLIRGENGVPITIGNVGKVEDSHQIQTNIVHIGDKRQVYIPIYRQPGANTIQIIDSMRSAIKSLLERLPKGMSLKIVADQSQFVRQSIKSIYSEVGLGGVLASLVVLIFLGSLRASFAVFLSIPLSILTCFIGLYATGETINAMTLGGLALAVGILIDNSVVVLENSIRHFEMGKPIQQAVLDAVGEVAMPVMAGTICIVIVFIPVIFFTGIGKFLFTPLAKSVAFSVLASYVVSMTIIPLYCVRFISKKQHEKSPEKGQGGRFKQFAQRYQKLLSSLMKMKGVVILGFTLLFCASLFLYPFIGKELFPRSDVGYLTIYLHLPTGTRIEKTEETMKKVEQSLNDLMGVKTIDTMITNIGVLYDWPAAYTPNSGPGDAFIELELSSKRKFSTEEYANKIRELFKREYPNIQMAINTGGLITAALNMGLSSPINIQVEGSDLKTSMSIAEEIVKRAKRVKGAVDVRIQEHLDYPQIEIELDRTKIAARRMTVEEVVKNIVTALNSSINFKPSFWIDPKNGNHYFLGAQYPEEFIKSIKTLENLPLTGKDQKQIVFLKEIAKFKETSAPSEVRHRNIQRVVNVFVNTSGRDVGSVASEINQRIKDIKLPEGYRINQRGEVQSMQESFQNLGGGLILAVILIYLVLVGQFRSFRDPLLILISVPMGLIGVLLTLWLTRTTLNVQSFIGIIFMVGIAVLNGILLIEFANRLKGEGQSAEEAAINAAGIRLRPILMTTCAALFSLLPMAIGLGHGAEANVPLGRAVVGGLSVSAVLTLIILPLLYVAVEKVKYSKTSIPIVKTILIFFILSLLSTAAFAESAPALDKEKVLTLQDALDKALNQNPKILIAKARTAQAQAEVDMAKSGYWPRLNLSAMDSYGLGSSSQAIGISGVVNSTHRIGGAVGVDSMWTIYDFGRTSNKVQAARYEFQAQDQDMERQMVQIKLMIIRTYGDCAFYTGLDYLGKEWQQRQELLVEEIQKYTRSGLSSPVDLNLMQAALEKTYAAQAESDGSARQSVEKLKEWMGDSQMASFVCGTLPEMSTEVPGLDALITQALKERPEIKTAQKHYEAAQASLRSAEGEHAPKIVAVSSVGELEKTDSANGDQWSAGIGVVVPFFDGFLTEAKIAKAKAQETEAKAALEEAHNHIQQEIASSYAQWQAAQQMRPIIEKQYQLTKGAYDLAHQRYIEKMGTFIELQNAESAFAQVQQEQLKAQIQEKLSFYQLLIVSGMEISSVGDSGKNR
ncbi:MAG: efflux RND transporter permease subunit [Candidatus Omnitrophica bacterium]|nr:efflux RND transporter permease subunit [Candidatus Omnitrophota bacterium]